MRIAADLRLNARQNYPGFITELWVQLARHYPENQFIFATNGRIGHEKELAQLSNVTIEKVKHKRSGVWQWWPDLRLSRILMKSRPDVYVCEGGNYNRFITIPQVLVVQYSAAIPLAEYGRTLLKGTEKAGGIVTTSMFQKNELQLHLPAGSVTISNINLAARDIYQPVGWKEKEALKEQYATGCEYFVVTADMATIDNLVPLLKAFTIFKGRQRTNMKLLVITLFKPGPDSLSEMLQTYKLKNEVKVVDNLNETEFAKLLAGAYAFVSTGLNDAAALQAIGAMQCEVPVLVAGTEHMREATGNCALYIEPGNQIDIAEQLKTIYKDENLRSTIVNAGRLHTATYNWQTSARLMMMALEEAISN